MDIESRDTDTTLEAANVEQLAAAVIASARSCGVTFVTAESCTAGAIAYTLSRVPGAGDHLDGGFVVYSKDMKTQSLGVDPQLLARKTAVCAEVAEAMALGALHRSPADVAVAVTGVAGPEPDEDGNPVGLMYFCATKKGGAPLAVRRHFNGLSRDQTVAAAICESLRLLKRFCR